MVKKWLKEKRKRRKEKEGRKKGRITLIVRQPCPRYQSTPSTAKKD